MFFELVFYAAVAVLVYMTGIYILSLINKDSSIVDIGWGPGFMLVSVLTLLFSGQVTERSLLLMGLVTVWGLRLGIHIFLRNRGRPEDWRYQQWRQDWGKAFWWRSYFQVFLLQGVLMVLISLPVIFIHAESGYGLTWPDVAGVCVWLVGFLFESVGDLQLMKFKKDVKNKGKIMKSGLWRYTRHPNYFGEVTLWWGVFLIAATVPGSLFTFIGTLTITFFILGVSGIPMLERKYQDNKEFQQYAKETSAFFPWFPKAKV